MLDPLTMPAYTEANSLEMQPRPRSFHLRLGCLPSSPSWWRAIWPFTYLMQRTKPGDGPATFNKLTTTASELQRLYEAKKISVVDVVLSCRAQIEEHNTAGRKLCAVVSQAPESQVLDFARLLDSERLAGKVRSPLHGTPIVVKDCISTHPDSGMGTTCGSWALATSRVAHASPVIQRVEDAGLVILGKSNLTEFNNWKGTGIISGWSPVGGQTLSAYVKYGIDEKDLHLGHSTPGGSSAGSAVSVAAGFSILSLGQETNGSLMAPGSRSALFSIKPTIGHVTMDGTLGVARTFDTIGPMARSAEDLALLTEIIMEPSARAKLPEHGYKSVMTGSWHGLRIGFLDPSLWKLPPSLCEPNKDVSAQMEQEYFAAIKKIKDLGAHTEYPVSLPTDVELIGLDQIMLNEYRANFEGYVSQLERSEVRTLDELILWNIEHAEIELPQNQPDQSLLIESAKTKTSEEDNSAAIAKLRKIARDNGVDATMDRYKLDAIAVLMDSPLAGVASAAGYPVCTMPLGYLNLNGRPFGMGMIARQNADALLFKIMSAWDATFPKRKPPIL